MLLRTWIDPTDEQTEFMLQKVSSNLVLLDFLPTLTARNGIVLLTSSFCTAVM
jgi:hypothetical protein